MRNTIQLIALVFFLFTNCLYAHHKTFYSSLFEAVEKKDLESVKPLFSDVVWKGERGKPSVSEIQKRLKSAKSVKFLREYSTPGRVDVQVKIRCVVLFRLTEGDEGTPAWIYLLAEKPGTTGAKGGFDDDSWRVVRIEDNLEWARKFIGNEFFSDISTVSPGYEAEQGDAEQPATAPESKAEGDGMPKPESEGRSR